MAADDETLMLLWVDVPAGSRMSVQTGELPANLARMAAPAGKKRSAGLTVDGYALKAYGPGITDLALPSGLHRFPLVSAQAGVKTRLPPAAGAVDATLFSEDDRGPAE